MAAEQPRAAGVRPLAEDARRPGGSSDKPDTAIMGILNVTADSFSDGGRWLDPALALSHAQAMAREGAGIVDVGAESTRPGAVRVPEEAERERVVRTVSDIVRWRSEQAALGENACGASFLVSVDTTRASVAAAALAAGADIINDVSGGLLDPRMAPVVAEAGCRYVVQHWRGWMGPDGAAETGQADCAYPGGVIEDVRDELMRRVEAVGKQGVAAENIIIDPGLGFSKPGIDVNFTVLAGLERFVGTGYPVLVGASRKGFLKAALRRDSARSGCPRSEAAVERDLDAATAATAALCALQGAWAVRVHAVAATAAALAVAREWRKHEERGEAWLTASR